MESGQYKRRMQTRVTAQNVDPDIAKLSTIGMRIRQAVSNGYHRPQEIGGNMASSYSQPAGGYGNEINQNSTFNRVPLPSHLDGPPGLTNMGSTVGTSSNLSEWENNNYSRLVSISDMNMSSGKRKFNDIQDTSSYQIPIRNDKDYEMKYGELRFDEDF